MSIQFKLVIFTALLLLYVDGGMFSYYLKKTHMIDKKLTKPQNKMNQEQNKYRYIYTQLVNKTLKTIQDNPFLFLFLILMP